MAGLFKNELAKAFCTSFFKTQPKIISPMRYFCDSSSPAASVAIEKCLNQVTLLGRVGTEPQLRGSEERPVVIFTLATNLQYRNKKEGVDDLFQKTEWHRISIFKPHLRDLVQSYLKKGSRILIQGRLVYGEVADSSGSVHQTTTIVADDIVFVGLKKPPVEELD